MIEYGIACTAVVVIALMFERRAVPFALTILAGWCAGFLAPQWWPWISVASGLALFWFMKRDFHWRWAAVTALAGTMLLLDLIYLWFRWKGFHIEVEYANALTRGLEAQLLLTGIGGVGNAVLLLLSWGRRNVRDRRYLAIRRLFRDGQKETAG